MQKDKVLRLFGGAAETAAACEVTRQAVGQWPRVLTFGLAAKVVGAAMRTGLELDAKKAFPGWFK